jgi:hypothetical protein
LNVPPLSVTVGVKNGGFRSVDFMT